VDAHIEADGRKFKRLGRPWACGGRAPPPAEFACAPAQD